MRLICIDVPELVEAFEKHKEKRLELQYDRRKTTYIL